MISTEPSKGATTKNILGSIAALGKKKVIALLAEIIVLMLDDGGDDDDDDYDKHVCTGADTAKALILQRIM